MVKQFWYPRKVLTSASIWSHPRLLPSVLGRADYNARTRERQEGCPELLPEQVKNLVIIPVIRV